MSAFEPAVAVLLSHEGGYCNFANDPGGATNWGVSKVIRERFHLIPHDLEIPDFSDGSIMAMPRRAAERVYFMHWWVPWKLWQVNDQTVATKILDFGVNANPPNIAVGFAQQSCVALGRELHVDSRIGPLTVAAINACDAGEWMRDYCKRQLNFYELILKRKPFMEIPWRRVWTKRAAWGLPQAAPTTPPITLGGGT